jgi:predicted exporter
MPWSAGEKQIRQAVFKYKCRAVAALQLLGCLPAAYADNLQNAHRADVMYIQLKTLAGFITYNKPCTAVYA